MTPTPIIVAGIDPSLTNTAVVILSSCGASEHTLIRPGSLRGPARLTYIHDKILETFSKSKLPTPIFLAIEGYDYKGFSTIPLAECNAVIQVACYKSGIPLIHAAPAQVKKFATGCSQASKEMMIKRYNIRNEHIADARALAGIAMEYMHTTSVTRCELEVIKNIKKPKLKKKSKIPKLKTGLRLYL